MSEQYEETELPRDYEATDGEEFSKLATEESVTYKTVLADEDYNGVTIDDETGITVSSSLIQLLLNATKGIEITKLSTGAQLFYVDSVTGDIYFAGKLVGATGEFNGKLTADKVYIDPPNGLATLLLKTGTLVDNPSYAAIYSSPSSGGDITIAGYEETDGTYPPLNTITLKATNLNLTGKIATNNMKSDKTTITPSAPNTPTSKVISFGKTFASIPNVVATANTVVVGNVVTGVAVSNITTTGCTLWVTRTDTVDTIVHWIAMDV